MKKSWIAGLDKDESEEMRGMYLSSLRLRQRLHTLVEDKISSSYTTALTKSSYDNPNWALLQADHRGYERALHEILSLLE